jgi:DNA-binding transcriptional MerR regulator
VSDRPHLSIGEVLSLLQEEFSDITISKIRFLESQGLLDPERTPSGYRKFYDGDIERLRWILRQQKENFLPLKVIKDRLAESGGEIPAPEPPPPLVPVGPVTAVAPMDHAPVPPEAVAGGDVTTATLFDAGPTSVSMTADELAAAAGLKPAELEELEKFGLLCGRNVGPDVLYDAEALVVARLAAGFMRYGVEARHLRMYRTSAERESGFFEQLVMPMLKQRNPAARRQAAVTLSELAQLGEGMRAAMLRQALRDYSGQL